jgi:uncharacterized membrane protein HdeD (DUF308 family)
MVSVHLSAYSRTWWSLIIRGIAAAIFGIIAIAHPGGTIEFLVRLLGIFLLVVGIIATFAVMRHREESKKWNLLMVPGVIGIALGLIFILAPGAIAKIFVFLVGLGLFVYGIGEIYKSIRMRKDLAGDWMPLLVGVVALVLGIVLMAGAGHIAEAMMWIIGVIALVFGVLWTMLGLRARRWIKHADKPAEAQAEKPPEKPV